MLFPAPLGPTTASARTDIRREVDAVQHVGVFVVREVHLVRDEFAGPTGTLLGRLRGRHLRNADHA